MRSRKSGEATFLSAASYIISLLLFRRKVDRTDMIGALKDGRE